MRPTVSVVIPVKDDATLLDRCLWALAGQSDLPDEIVIVDNRSSDASAAIARFYGARVVRETIPGIPAAASTGYDAATGDIIARLDADSIPWRHWVATIRRAFERDPSLDGLTGPGIFRAADGRPRRVASAAFFGAYFLVAGAGIARVPLFGSTFALRRSTWQSVSGRVCRRDSRLHDDLDLSLHLPTSARVRYSRALAVGVSDRPLDDADALLRRGRMGMRTFRTHWPGEAPWRRWRERVIARRRPAGGRRHDPAEPER